MSDEKKDINDEMQAIAADKKPFFEKLRDRIETSHNSNFYFNKVDWATGLWIKELCDLIDDELIK